MKQITLLSALAICSLWFAVYNFASAQNNNNGLWFGLGPDTTFTNRHVKINKALFVLQKMVAKEIFADKITADSMRVHKRISIGNSSLILDVSTAQTGPLNNIFTTAGDLFIQDVAGATNTIFHSNNTGKVGIGTTTPSFKLEVNNDINLTSSVQNQGYRIGGIVVLQKPGIGNIFADVNNIS